MAEIRPFRGVHYNPLLVKDPAAVICPPYDIITPQMREELYQRSEYNFVRLELARESPQDTPVDNKYTRSSAALEQWLKQGILKIDEAPAIYLHDHYFTHQRRKYRRRGIIVIVRLEPWSQMVVRPHEGTLAEPKSDRLNLLWALQADTSPIFAMFEDQGKKVASLLTAQEKSEPMIDVSMNGESHRLWAISGAGAVNQIYNSLAGQPLYIADGHHRYESALNYQRERRACSQSARDVEPFDFVMMTLVEFSDPGLVILPTHRLVRGLSESTMSELMPGLQKFFGIEELPLNTSDIWQRVDRLLGKGKIDQLKLVMFGPAKDRLYVLTLRDFAVVGQMMPYFHSELYKRLNVSVVDHIILERVLSLSRDKEASCLAYSHDRQDAVNKVLNQEYQMALLLSPVKAGVIKAIADASDRMPRKSTYFYPKLPSGLVFYRLV